MKNVPITDNILFCDSSPIIGNFCHHESRVTGSQVTQVTGSQVTGHRLLLNPTQLEFPAEKSDM
jgi:hypothetical protein